MTEDRRRTRESFEFLVLSVELRKKEEIEIASAYGLAMTVKG